MNTKRFERLGLFMALAGLLLSGSLYSQGSTGELIKGNLVLDSQSSKGGNGFWNLKEAKAHNLLEAALDQGSIDIIYAHGKSTGVNLMTPASSGIKLYNVLRGTVYDSWSTKNKGVLIALGDGKELRKKFKKLKEAKDVEGIYEEGFRNVMLRDDYNKGQHGPSGRIHHLEIGDYFVFRSMVRDLYAMGRVVNMEEGYSGSVNIDYKIGLME